MKESESDPAVAGALQNARWECVAILQDLVDHAALELQTGTMPLDGNVTAIRDELERRWDRISDYPLTDAALNALAEALCLGQCPIVTKDDLK
jgi:hypothetical protein